MNNTITFIIKYIYLVPLGLFLFSILRLLGRYYVNSKVDNVLGIETRGLRNSNISKLHNRTESTPYLALNSLVEEYKVDPSDQVVDYGSGKGRVAIYLNALYDINTKGVEIGKESFKDAEDNLKSYLSKVGKDSSRVEFIYEYAENYEIEKGDNKFFFFNPFHEDIFDQVLNNIVEDAEVNNKEVDVILYFPMRKFKSIISKKGGFELVKEIKTSGMISPREKFLIYRFNGMK